MKNKGLTIILLLVVGYIWYNVFFRIKSSIEPLVKESKSHLDITPIKINKNRMKYVVDANYRDPFGNATAMQLESIVPLSNSTPVTPTVPVIKKEKPTVPPVRWPSIRYHGSVRSQKQIKSRAILKIDGQLYTLQEGQGVLDGMLVVKIYLDSIRLDFNKQQKIFYRHIN
jgi:hypothetical protein